MRTQEIDVVKDLNIMIDSFIEMDKSKYEHIINHYAPGASCGLFKTRDEFVNFLKWRSSHPIAGYAARTHKLYLGNFNKSSTCDNNVNHNVSIFFNWYTGELRLEFNRRQYDSDVERKYISNLTSCLCSFCEGWVEDSYDDWMHDSGEFVWLLSRVSYDSLSIAVEITFKAKPDEEIKRNVNKSCQ